MEPPCHLHGVATEAWHSTGDTGTAVPSAQVIEAMERLLQEKLGRSTERATGG